MHRRTLKNYLTNNGEIAWDRKKLCVWLAAVSALVFGVFVPGRIVVAVSPSLDHRIFIIDKRFVPEEIRKDDYVIFTVRSPYIKNGTPSRLMKKVSCVTGDRLETRNLQYFCNGQYLGMAKWHSLRGEPVDAFVFSGAVPEGKFFVTGHHVDSFDSRYLGFVERRNVEAIAHPLL